LKVKEKRVLATIINLWDDLGTEGCIKAERIEVVSAVFKFKELFLDKELKDEEEKAIVLSAFCQEY